MTIVLHATRKSGTAAPADTRLVYQSRSLPERGTKGTGDDIATISDASHDRRPGCGDATPGRRILRGRHAWRQALRKRCHSSSMMSEFGADGRPKYGFANLRVTLVSVHFRRSMSSCGQPCSVAYCTPRSMLGPA